MHYNNDRSKNLNLQIIPLKN